MTLPISDLTYINYAENRRCNPEISPERWAKAYGPDAEWLEARYQRERFAAQLTHADCEFLELMAIEVPR